MAASAAASPSATAAVCTTKPVHNPITTVRPARRPHMADCSKTNTLSGPGASASRTAMPKKAAAVSGEIMAGCANEGAADCSMAHAPCRTGRTPPGVAGWRRASRPGYDGRATVARSHPPHVSSNRSVAATGTERNGYHRGRQPPVELARGRAAPAHQRTVLAAAAALEAARHAAHRLLRRGTGARDPRAPLSLGPRTGTPAADGLFPRRRLGGGQHRHPRFAVRGDCRTHRLHGG